MTEIEIQKLVEISIMKSIQGQSVERPNLDFKRQWPLLTKKENEYYKFFRSICAMANTNSGKYGLIIYGFDDNNKTFHEAKFSDTGLKDSSYLYNLIVKNITEPFPIEIHNVEFEGNILNVVKINNSIAKPHVLKEYKIIRRDGTEVRYENYIAVRKESQVKPASKYDLDQMYYDRKNLIFEKKINLTTFSIGNRIDIKRVLFMILTIENLGIQYAAIRHFYLETFGDNGYKMCINVIDFREKNSSWIKPGDENILIPPNTIFDLQLNFPDQFDNKYDALNILKNNKISSYIVAETLAGQKIRKKIDHIFELDDIRTSYI